MPSSIHKTEKVALAKGKRLLKKGKRVKFDITYKQKMVKGKRVGRRKAEYKVTWK